MHHVCNLKIQLSPDVASFRWYEAIPVIGGGGDEDDRSDNFKRERSLSLAKNSFLMTEAAGILLVLQKE